MFEFESLESVESNVEPTEDRAHGFASMLAQYEAHGAITIDADTSPVIREATNMLAGNLDDHLGKDVLARRLGYNADDISAMRESLSVLQPLSDAISARRDIGQQTMRSIERQNTIAFDSRSQERSRSR